MDQVNMTDEQQAGLDRLREMIGPGKVEPQPPTTFQIDLRSITVALSAVALLMGKDPDTVDIEVTAIRAKEMGTALFGPLSINPDDKGESND